MSNDLYIRPLNDIAFAHVNRQYESSFNLEPSKNNLEAGRQYVGKFLNDRFAKFTEHKDGLATLRARLRPEDIDLYNSIITGVMSDKTNHFTPLMVIDLLRKMGLGGDWYEKRVFQEKYLENFPSKYGMGIIVEDILRSGVKTSPNTDNDTVMRIVYHMRNGTIAATAYSVVCWNGSEFVKDTNEFGFQDLSGVGGNCTNDFTKAEKYLVMETKYDGTAWLETNDSICSDGRDMALFLFTVKRMYERCGELTDHQCFEYTVKGA